MRLLILTSWLLTTSSVSNALSLDDYLSEVRRGNPEYIAQQKQYEGAQLKASEGKLIFRPKFFSEVQFSHDGKPATPPLLVYNHIESLYTNAGIEQTFSFGLHTKIYYQFTRTHFFNSPYLMGDTSRFFDVNPTIELSLPILGNGFGRTARSQRDAIEASNQAEAYAAEAKRLALEAQAQSQYWNLALARQSKDLQKSALKSAQEILTYIERQTARRLADESDRLQASALVASRKLELKNAEIAYENTRAEFNLLRGQPEDHEPDSLDTVPDGLFKERELSLTPPGDRLDVKASIAQAKATRAQLTQVSERNKPTLDVFSLYAMNGRDHTFQGSNSSVEPSDRGTFKVGLKLVIPLSASTAKQAITGARIAQDAQDNLVQHQQLLQQKDWATLRRSLIEMHSILSLAQDLVDAQSKRLSLERKNLELGKTTTYQVLVSEQDKSQAEISQIELKRQYIALQTQVLLYERNQAP